MIRPIRPEDAEIEQAFVRSLSPEAKYLRFMSTLKELTPAMLARFTLVDYDREMALIAVAREGAREAQIGVAAMSSIRTGSRASSRSSWRKRGRAAASAVISWSGSSTSRGRAA